MNSEQLEAQDQAERSAFRLSQPMWDGNVYLIWNVDGKALGTFPTMEIAVGVIGVIEQGEEWMRVKRRVGQMAIAGGVVAVVTIILGVVL